MLILGIGRAVVYTYVCPRNIVHRLHWAVRICKYLGMYDALAVLDALTIRSYTTLSAAVRYIPYDREARSYRLEHAKVCLFTRTPWSSEFLGRNMLGILVPPE